MANEIEQKIKFTGDIEQLTGSVNKIQELVNKLKMPEGLKSNFTKIFQDYEKQAQKAAEATQSGFKKTSDITKYEQALTKINTLFLQLSKNMGKIDDKIIKESFQIDTSKLEQAKKDIADIQKEISQNITADGLKQVTSTIEQMSQMSKNSNINKFFEAFKSGDIKAAEEALKGLEQGVKRFSDKTDEGKQKGETFNGFVKALTTQLDTLRNSSGDLPERLKLLTQSLGSMENDQLQEFVKLVQEGKDCAEQLANEGPNITKGMLESAQATQHFNSELEQVKNRISYFFGLNNAIQLVRRALRSTLETVKDLDKVMTETAVVTSFSVGDMWSQLPEYTKRANELGVSIHSAYEAATLFYQQGLSTNQVMQVSNETLKMARIAGLDAAEATDRMTNALRGFNMEINEANSQNINDVYSALAAKTASNVDEISTAMTKVASLANNANMSFENTAAFLSQIIETTRESAETAGTALKTVIARFSEVKKLYSEDKLLGTDSEGIEIDVNKISTALRTAGINMNEYLTGAKGLDEIFIELSKKWDSLTTVQQRYIATMAAGSRQQSRFIALMQDSARMNELTGIATNANGESQKQFEKTLESLETKLNQLHNAWNEFLMGIANSDVIKFGVDLLTQFLNVINKATSGLPGLTSSLSKLLVIIGAFKAGRGLFNGSALGGMFSKLRGQAGKEGAAAGLTFGQRFSQTTSSVMQKGVKGTIKNWGKNFASGFDLKALRDSHNKVVALKKEVADLTDKRKQLNDESQAAIDTNEDLKTKTKELNEAESQYAQQQNKLKSSVNSVASSAMAAGMAFTMFAGLLEQMGAPKEATDVFKYLGIALMGVSLILPILSNGVELFGNKALVAGIKAQSAFWPLLIITLAIVATLAIILLVVKAISDTSDATKFKKLNKEIEETKNCLEDAKSSLDEMTESKSKLEEMQEEFRGLAVGSEAWRKKLVEINQEVLDLVNKYPELAGYIERTAEGSLGIKESGWDDLINKQQQSIATLTQTQFILEGQKANLSNQVNFKNKVATNDWETSLVGAIVTGGLGFGGFPILSTLGSIYATNEKFAYEMEEFLDTGWGTFTKIATSILGGPVGTILTLSHEGWGGVENAEKRITGGLTRDEFNKFAAGITEKGIDINENEDQAKALYQSLFKTTDGFDSVIAKCKSLGKSFDELGAQAYKEQLEKEGRTKAIIASALQTDQSLTSNKNFTQIQEAVTDAYLKDYNTKLDEEKENIKESGDALKKLYSKIPNVYYENGKLYKDKEATQEMNLSDDTIKKAIASYQVQQKIVSTANILARAAFKNGTENALTRLYSVNSSSFTQTDLKELLNGKEATNLTESDINNWLNQFGTSLEKLGLTIEEFTKRVEISESDFEKAQSNLKKYGIKEEVASMDFTAGELRGFNTQIATLEENVGEESTKEFINSFVEAFGDAEIPKEAWEKFFGSNWTQALDIYGLGKEIKKFLPPKIADTIIKNLENVADKMIDLAGASTILSEESWDAKQQNYQEAKKLLDAGTTLFEKDDYQKLLGAGLKPDAFIEGFGGTYVLKGSAENAQVAIDQIWEEILQGWIHAFKQGKVSAQAVGQKILEYAQGGLGDILANIFKWANEGAGKGLLTTDLLNLLKDSMTYGQSTMNEPEKIKYWQNPFDELANELENINYLTRERTRLEKQYQIELARGNDNIEQFRKNYKERMELLYAEQKQQEEMTKKRKNEIGEIGNEYYIDGDTKKKYSDYTIGGLKLNQFAWVDEKTGRVIQNTKAINQLEENGYANYGKVVESYINELTKRAGLYQDSMDKELEIAEEIEDNQQTVIDSYLSFEERVLDAIKTREEKQIEALEKVNDAVEKTTSKIISNMREQIDLQRQQRDNEKKQQSINDKEARLQYLRMDTTGANNLEILQLEKDLQEEREGYVDTLIDQSIEQMEKDAQKAQEQRQEQIETMKSIEEINRKNGGYWEEVNDLMNTAFDSQGHLKNNSALVNLLKQSDNFESLSKVGKENWWKSLKENVANASLITVEVNENGEFSAKVKESMEAGKKAQKGLNETNQGLEELGDRVSALEDKVFEKPSTTTSSVEKPEGPIEKYTDSGSEVSKRNSVLQYKTYGLLPSLKEEASNLFPTLYKKYITYPTISFGEFFNFKEQIDKFLPYLSLEDQGKINGKFTGVPSKNNTELIKRILDTLEILAGYFPEINLKKIYTNYATGGLADFTGPAWLDGTRTKPELILNQTDTQNFIALRDVLASLLANAQTGFGVSGGDNYFDINIEAELGSDYDVDQLANRIKKQIYDDSSYRNVNTIGLLR